VLGWTSVLGAAASADSPGSAHLHVHTSYELNPYLLMEEPTTTPTVRSRVDDGDLKTAVAAVAELRRRVDFVVVLIHWGRGLSDELDEYQRPLGHALVDAGADLIVGSHPHRVLGIETYRGKTILYSPGTLIDQMPRQGVDPAILAIYERLSPDSYLAWVEVSPSGAYEIRLRPTTLGAGGVAVPAEGDAFERIAERIRRMSAALGTVVGLDKQELVIAPSTPA
jgi:poly-gamma-glutamate capsule biosynthesis protein CapA/YwtB (metallophosphatase superfamily)